MIKKEHYSGTNQASNSELLASINDHNQVIGENKCKVRENFVKVYLIS